MTGQPEPCFPLLSDEKGDPIWPQGERPPPDEPVPDWKADEVLFGPGTDANAIKGKLWNLLVPEQHASALVERLRPLIELREHQMGRTVEPLIVPRAIGEDQQRARKWVANHLLVPDTDDQPEYLLIAGDLDEITLGLQRSLPPATRVGRIAFATDDRQPDLERYARYAAKVVHYHAARSEQRPDVLLCHVADGTAATHLAERSLLEPMTTWLEARNTKKGAFGRVLNLSDGGFGQPAPADLLNAPGVDAANILLTASHGRGVKEPARRHLDQGAMSFGSRDLSAADLADRPFLPGGLWIYIACFGAGTPSASAFAPWLQKLFPNGPYAQRALAKLAPRPFVSTIAQAALANPDGPLAMLAHVDLAWSYGLTEQLARRTKLEAHRRFSDAIVRLGITASTARARTFGLMLDELSKTVRRFDKANAVGRIMGEKALCAEAWMARQDLDGYILLGDPAARLPYGQEEG